MSLAVSRDAQEDKVIYKHAISCNNKLTYIGEADADELMKSNRVTKISIRESTKARVGKVVTFVLFVNE